MYGRTCTGSLGNRQCCLALACAPVLHSGGPSAQAAYRSRWQARVSPRYYYSTGQGGTSSGTPCRAYYAGGPWSGNGWSYTGWSDYATRAGIGCTPGSTVKGGDGILYLCQ